MPCSAELTGKIFGALTVTRSGGRVPHGGGDRTCGAWWCVCDCGREKIFKQPYLVSGRVTQCSVCRRGPCVVCGGEITRQGRSNACSDECETAKRQNIKNRSYAKRTANDPDFNRRRGVSVAKKMAADPIYAERVRSVRRAANRRYRQTLLGQEVQQQYQASRWQAQREQILAQRQRFWEELSPKEQQSRNERRQTYDREWKRNFRKWLDNNPDELALFRSRYKQWKRESDRQKSLSGLRDVAEKLQEKLDDE